MVETVIVGGKTIMRDRELMTVDPDEIATTARERARALWARM